MTNWGRWLARAAVLLILFASLSAMLWWDPQAYFRRVRQDHIVHFIVFYALMLGLTLSFPKCPVWLVAALLLVFSIGLEYIQPFFGRECSLSDMISNLITIGLAMLTLWVGKALQKITDKN